MEYKSLGILVSKILMRIENKMEYRRKGELATRQGALDERNYSVLASGVCEIIRNRQRLHTSAFLLSFSLARPG